MGSDARWTKLSASAGTCQNCSQVLWHTEPEVGKATLPLHLLHLMIIPLQPYTSTLICIVPSIIQGVNDHPTDKQGRGVHPQSHTTRNKIMQSWIIVQLPSL